MDVRIKLLDPDAQIPARASDTAAGYDLVTVSVDTLLQPGEKNYFHTGIALEIPHGYEGQVRPRSGLSCRESLIIPNSPGTIDSDYRGELKVCLLNISQHPKWVKKGTRIAQLVIAPVKTVTFRQVEEISDTARGKGGYGSTGL